MSDFLNNNELDESSIKKSKERSAAYPAITINAAIAFVSEINKHFRSSWAKRSDILALVDNSHNRFIAASAYYTLLRRDKDSYQITDLFKSIINPISEKEKRTSLLQAFESPKLNKELIEKFDGDVIPKELPIHLYRFHKITEDAANIAADIFINNASICQVIDGNGRLVFNQELNKLRNPNFDFAEITNLENKPQITNSANSSENIETFVPLIEQPIIQKQKYSNTQNNLLLDNSSDEKLRIRLTENKIAYLHYPINITKKDIYILRKQLDVLEEVAE